MGGTGMLVGRGFEVAGDKAGPVGHGAGMRWVLMLFVILAAVMGGEARAVVGTGRVVVSERDVESEAVERESGALRIVSRGMIEDAEAAAGVLDAWPLGCWFPGGSAVARSDCGDLAVNVRHAAGTLDRGGLMFDSHEERGAGMWTYMTLKRSTMESGHANGQLEHMRRAAIVQFDNWQNQYYEGGADAAKLGLINAMDFTGAGDAAYNGKSALEVAARIGVGGLSVAFGGAALGAMRGTYAAGSAAGAMGLASAGSDLVLQGGLGVVDAIAGNEVKPYSWTQTAGAFLGGAVVGKLAGRLGGAKTPLPKLTPTVKPGSYHDKPPGWSDSWKWHSSTRAKPGSDGWRWRDPQGGEWRRHVPDKHHPEAHWDYNPNTQWNSPWSNIDDNGNYLLFTSP